MAETRRKYTRIKEDSLLEEPTDRDGRWQRDFSFRAIIWPLLEHWAAENRYRLIAMRSNRRLYVLGDESTAYRTYLELRQDGSRVRLKSWIETSFRVRALRLWMVPVEMNPSPEGWGCLGYRRRACHQMNSLLERCGQPPILGSQGFHLVDQDSTTLILGGSLAAALALLAWRSSFQLALPADPWRLELWEPLLTPLALPGAVATLLAAVLVAVHQKFVVGRFSVSVRWASLALALSLVFAVTLSLAKWTGPRVAARRLTLECVLQFDAARCAALVAEVPERERGELAGHLRALHQELVRPPGAL